MTKLMHALLTSAATATLLLCIAAHAAAQFNKAYDEAYRPMLDLAGQLRELADSAEKRAAYATVKALAKRYDELLNKAVYYFENSLSSSGMLKEQDNRTWIHATLGPTLSSTRFAQSRAQALYQRADASQDSRPEVVGLQSALTALSDEFRKCWQQHQDRLQKLRELYVNALDGFRSSTRDARRPVTDLGAKVTETRDRLNELSGRAREAGRLYIDAQDACDRARAELFTIDLSRTPEEVKGRYDTWVRADDLVRRVNVALVEANKAAADAQRAFSDAVTAWERALAEFDRKEGEYNLLYQIVLERHRRLFEMAQEYRPFSW